MTLHDFLLEGRGYAGPAGWSLTEESLLITPEGHPPFSLLLAEIQGLQGDGYSLSLRLGGEEMAMKRLGADGPTLLAELRRRWPSLRARALLLVDADDGEAPTFACSSDGEPAQVLLHEHVLLAVPDGRDVDPVFLPLLRRHRFDAESYSVRCETVAGAARTFSRLGPRTQEFLALLDERRGRLVETASRTLGDWLPGLSGASRVALASDWLPGRLLDFAALEAAAPGIEGYLRGEWLAGLPRAAEGEALLDWAPRERSYLGYQPAPEGETPLFWLLAGREDRWLLEVLSSEDNATYVLDAAPGDTKPAGLVEQFLCVPGFRREALYLSPGELVGDRAPLALPARELPALRALRAAFRARVIHGGLDAWRREALG